MKHIFEDINKMKFVLKEVINLKSDDRIIRIFEYFLTNNDIEIEEFDKLISEIKGEKEMKPLFEVWREAGLQIGLERGMQQGMQNEKKIIVMNSLKQNLDIKTISLITGLTIEEIKELKNSIMQ